jgi:tetratricopeptide (TPR) repeat protein
MKDRGQPVEPKEWADALVGTGQHDRAAEAYQKLGEVDAAVRANLDAGQLAQAAQLLAQQGHHARAATLLMSAGDPRLAREQFLLAKDAGAAANAALQAGMFFEAGRDYFSIGDWTRAVDAFQRIPENHPQYRQAVSLLGQAFFQLDDHVLAIRMHRRAIADLRLSRENLDLFYQLALVLEESPEAPEREEAKQIYADILAEHYTYRDARARHEQLCQPDTAKIKPPVVMPR